MNMTMKSISIVLICSIVVAFAACQSYQRQVVPFKMPAAYPNATGAAGAIIASKSYDSKEAQAVFGFDIVGAGVVPVQVLFDNKGEHPIEIIPDQTFLTDSDDNLWPILESSLAYDRIAKKTELGRVAPEATKFGALTGIAGAMIGAAIGVVTGTNVGEATLSGAALGAAAGATMGGAKGLLESDVKEKIRGDLQKRSLENKTINPGDLAYSFVFFPGESAKPVGLRLKLKEKDTGAFHTLIMKLQ
ncbi:MAG TPA: hypothetical protein PKM08_02920 [Syntrophorhabdaceae bacterium]|nr:hypothetical protein [Syntrophorhabdaceae bacterium]HNT67601.1 hypothetical protein [Syntrophorhabdaceae bacterium]